jgi:hypothetical protein
LEIIKDIDELMEYVFRYTDLKMLLSMDSEDIKIIQTLLNTIEKSKNLSLLMARKIDRQEEILLRLNRYLDEQERSKVSQERE